MLGVALVATTLVWFGLTFGLSFIETPLKFQAPGVTLAIGLEIGRLVFGVLNKIEIGLAVVTVALLIAVRPQRPVVFLLGMVVVIVAIQSVYLLPLLDERALQVIAGRNLSETSHHRVYVALELAKLSCLAVGGVYHARRQLVGASGAGSA